MKNIVNFLMFTGNAKDAMEFYTSIFENSEIVNAIYYNANEHGAEGTVKRATFVINGQTFMCIDSPPVHAFNFTPSLSLYIDCDSENEIEKLYNSLAEGGAALMPLGAYPFSKKYGWVNDKFGVSWQLNFNK